MSDSAAYRDFTRAAAAYRAGDSARWVFAFYAARVVGSYTDGSRQLAELIGGVSVDTVEHAAHAYTMFRALRRIGVNVWLVRGSNFVFLSHFLVLSQKQRKYDLGFDQCADYLDTVYQGQGDFSSRDLARLIDEQHGDERVLSYDAGRLQKAVSRFLSRPDLSRQDRVLFQRALDRLGELSRSEAGLLLSTGAGQQLSS